MRAARFIWRGVLAFDRIGQRIPQLAQMWLLELFLALPLTFFIARIIDIRGAFGVPGTGESLGGVFWAGLVVALACGYFWLRSLLRPRVIHGSWTPMVSADAAVFGGNRAWKVEYDYLTSHPSYSLLVLLTAPIPVVMVWMTANHGDNTFYWRVAGHVGIIVLALMAVTRLFAWYVLRLGRTRIDAHAARQGVSQRRLGWEMAWKPALMFIVLIYGFGGAVVGYRWWDELRTIDNLPVVTADDGGVDQYRRVRGAVNGDPVYWATHGTGRGGNNYSGAGVLVDLQSGGEALLLAESLSVPDFVGVMNDVHDGVITAHGRVVGGITENQVKYYGFNEDSFPDAAADGRVVVLLEYP